MSASMQWQRNQSWLGLSCSMLVSKQQEGPKTFDSIDLFFVQTYV